MWLRDAKMASLTLDALRGRLLRINPEHQVYALALMAATEAFKGFWPPLPTPGEALPKSVTSFPESLHPQGAAEDPRCRIGNHEEAAVSLAESIFVLEMAPKRPESVILRRPFSRFGAARDAGLRLVASKTCAEAAAPGDYRPQAVGRLRLPKNLARRALKALVFSVFSCFFMCFSMIFMARLG